MGRKPKYKTDAERHAAHLESKKRSRAKKKGHVNWVKSLGKKLEAVANDGEDKPPETSGSPFADLPPLDIPSPPEEPTSEGDAPPAAATSESSAPSADAESSASSSPKNAGKIFDTEQLELMATQLAHDATMTLGLYASERGYFSFGEPFAKLAGIAAGVLVKAHASAVGISDEEAAAWVLGGIIGTNGVQAFRASREEAAQKAKAEANARASSAAKSEQQHATNGTVVPPAQQAARAAEQREAVGLVRGNTPVV